MSEPVKRYWVKNDDLKNGGVRDNPKEVVLLCAYERDVADARQELSEEIAHSKLAEAEIAALKARCEGMRVALEAAAKSLETLSNAGLRGQPLLDTMQNVRGYANSRATVARAVLSSLPVEGLVERGMP